MTPHQFREARRTLGLSQGCLAERLGVSSGRTVRKWEQGERDIPGPAIATVRLLLWLHACEMADPYRVSDAVSDE